jgi:hypothetical protein
MRPIAAALPKIAAKAIGRRGFAEASLITDWASIVGDELAAVSQPAKLSFTPGERINGTLAIHVQGGVATELQHLEPLVVERINGHFGYGAVARLRLVHAPLHRPPKRATARHAVSKPLTKTQQISLAELLGNVEDNEIRGALERLGSAIIRRDSKVK